jgi:hypothetical protein
MRECIVVEWCKAPEPLSLVEPKPFMVLEQDALYAGEVDRLCMRHDDEPR